MRSGQIGVSMGVVVAVVWAMLPLQAAAAQSATAPEAKSRVCFYDHYAVALKSFVDDRGVVDYRGLKASRQQLDAFVGALSRINPVEYENWSDAQKVAMWINAYNGLTLQAIINHYPIKSSFISSLRYPRNSIRQISGVWDKLEFVVMGRKRTLDSIEHSTLRQRFNEPRIHMALVCAAMGCPPLRNQPYRADGLDAQLDDQARRFLSDPLKFRIDRDKKLVYMSSIFKWFGDDFIKTYGTEDFAGHGAAERAVLNFISKHLTDSDRRYLRTQKYRIKYLSYDWSLNEQRPSK